VLTGLFPAVFVAVASHSILSADGNPHIVIDCPSAFSVLYSLPVVLA